MDTSSDSQSPCYELPRSLLGQARLAKACASLAYEAAKHATVEEAVAAIKLAEATYEAAKGDDDTINHERLHRLIRISLLAAGMNAGHLGSEILKVCRSGDPGYNQALDSRIRSNATHTQIEEIMETSPEDHRDESFQSFVKERPASL